MNMKLPRLVPPAGAPLPARAIVRAAVPSAREKSGFTEILRRRLGIRHVHFVSSGRAALTLLLRALQQLSNRREVIIPAYTCFSVPSSVVRAGLVVRLCDVDPKTLDFDRNALLRIDLNKVLCIIPSGLYGMPSDLIALGEISRASGSFLIDDAAQCLGATLAGRPCGTFGDAGFFSLGRGKNITTMGGGILITQREDLAQLMEQQVSELRPPSRLRIFSITLHSLLYAIMLAPSRYWVVNRLPFLDLGVSPFDPDFAMTKLSPFQMTLATQLLPFVDSYNRIRRENADRLHAGIKGVEGIEVPQPIIGARPVYLRFPILARNASHRARLVEGLGAAGIGASTSYPTAVGYIPGIHRHLARDQQPCPGAKSVATRIVTLPTHPYVTTRDIEKMVEIVRDTR